MARTASIAVGGFFPTPPHLVAPIASLVRVSNTGDYAILDPCAGDGAAIISLAEALWLDKEVRYSNVSVYANELEKTRFDALDAKKNQSGFRYGHVKVQHGDAFSLQWDEGGVSVGFLNPPYDLDKEHGRLEEKFLKRFAPAIHRGGVLIFLVPHYALAKSADTIARHFEDVHCVRFPAPDFDVFKQVVLVGRKRAALLDPDPVIRDRVLGWSANASTIPDQWDRPLVTADPCEDAGLKGWRSAPFDVTGILSHARPWHSTDRGGRIQPIQGIMPESPAHDSLERVFPVAMPLKPAYLAAGIAAGVFNGERIMPDDPTSGLPALLLKGTFNKDFVHVASEDKFNKEGDKTAETHVQQPELVITILDLVTKKYSQLLSSVDTTGERDPAKMSVGDLIANYGRSMIASMAKACPVQHDPARDHETAQTPGIGRPLFQAQSHAVTAACKVLGGLNVPLTARRGKAVYVLGEVGVGKTGVALATSVAVGARRTLVMCPPHLVPEWQEQVSLWFPDHHAVVLDDVNDVHALATSTDKRPTIAIMSRETAKLGHAWTGVADKCPRCCTPIETAPEELARKRARCPATFRTPANTCARLASRLGLALAQAAPNSPHVYQLLQTRIMRRALMKWRAKPVHGAWQKVLSEGRLQPIAEALVVAIMRSTAREWIEKAGDALTALLVAIGNWSAVERAARAIYAASADELWSYGHGANKRALAMKLLALLDKEQRDAAVSEVRESLKLESSYGARSVWSAFDSAVAQLDADGETSEHGYSEIDVTEEGVRYHEKDAGSVGAVLYALETLCELSTWHESKPCGERLYQAIPEPRRIALAPYIAKRFPRLFDFLICDEAHEVSGNQNSAQSMAAQRLVQLGIPTAFLTGSVMNGYAASMFMLAWMADSEFRREFDRSQGPEFVRRYGYIKIKVEYKDRDSGKNVAFGAVSDRVVRTEREAGNAPGVLPLFVLQYLLKRAVVLHKEDLAIDLPPCRQIVEVVEPGDDMLRRYKNLADNLKRAIKMDAFGPLAGKLFGQVSELPSYLDRATADTGNSDDGWWRVRYPEDCAGGLVAEQEPFPADTLLPKEQWMLDKVRAELAEGRRVLVFGYHGEVLPRLRRLIQEHLGEPCALLIASGTSKGGKRSVKASKTEGPVAVVAPDKRKPWIAENVIKPGIRVMVVNSTAVQTGLNNLVWFASIVWMENPAVNPIGYRQANGRIFRPGQTRETRVYFPVYRGTAQEQAHSLLMLKVGVSEGTDGLDARGAMAAAGVGEQATMSAFGVGKQLFALMEEEDARPKVRMVGIAPVFAPFKPIPHIVEPVSTEKQQPATRRPRVEPVRVEPQLKLF